jgi:hypothetical protein
MPFLLHRRQLAASITKLKVGDFLHDNDGANGEASLSSIFSSASTMHFAANPHLELQLSKATARLLVAGNASLQQCSECHDVRRINTIY